MSGGKTVAVIGGGIAGMGAAYTLCQKGFDVTLFEKEHRLGGHANTVITPEGTPVDTGFIVYNEQNYPQFTALLDQLGVKTIPSDMSFAASCNNGALEYGSSSLNEIFGQRRNLMNPRFYHLLFEIKKFFTHAVLAVEAGLPPDFCVEDYLVASGFSDDFIHWHLLPMAACIWSAPLDVVRHFPAHSLLRFFANHGLLQIKNRPPWRTISGGSKAYIEKIAPHLGKVINTPVNSIKRENGGILISTPTHTAHVDAAIMATHADVSLSLIQNPTPEEQSVLGAFRFQENRAVLHKDAGFMPHTKRVWSSWNYKEEHAGHLCVSYWMNRLQNLPKNPDYFLTLNPPTQPHNTVYETVYTHPVFDAAALQAQKKLPSLQGKQGLYFCGAWAGYGFHEDGLKSALDVCALVEKHI